MILNRVLKIFPIRKKWKEMIFNDDIFDDDNLNDNLIISDN